MNKAILEEWWLWLLVSSETVIGDVVGQVFSTLVATVISTSWVHPQRDAYSAVNIERSLYIDGTGSLENSQFLTAISQVLFYPFRFYYTLEKMADNLRRAVQDINLGIDDAPVALPAEIVANAAAENRFILMGRPVMSRRQNLRSIVASMPRVWGQSGLVHGRIVGGNQFQFIFPSEEAMDSVIRRGPWAFND